jgi:hypothetical protein
MVERLARNLEKVVKQRHDEGKESIISRGDRPINLEKLQRRLQEINRAPKTRNFVADEGNLPRNVACKTPPPAIPDIPFSPSNASYQTRDLLSLNITPDRSRDTSRPSTSDRDSFWTPESSMIEDGLNLTPSTLFSSDSASASAENLLNDPIFPRLAAPCPRQPSDIPRSVPDIYNAGGQFENQMLDSQIVNETMSFSSPSSFGTPTPSEAFQTLMARPIKSPDIPSEILKRKLGQKEETLPEDIDSECPRPETWHSLCLYVNVFLTENEVSAAEHLMTRAAMIYQRLVQHKNDQLLSILFLMLTNFFLHRKGDLAAQLLGHAKIAASVYLDEDDPIMVSIEFMIATAQVTTLTCGITIDTLRHIARDMKAQWGVNHPFCITADYHLAWRLAREPDFLLEALSILLQTQNLAERVFDPVHMQTVACITTRARVLGHLGFHEEAAKAMGEAVERVKSWVMADDYPYYVEIKRRHRIFVEELERHRAGELVISGMARAETQRIVAP